MKKKTFNKEINFEEVEVQFQWKDTPSWLYLNDTGSRVSQSGDCKEYLDYYFPDYSNSVLCFWVGAVGFKRVKQLDARYGQETEFRKVGTKYIIILYQDSFWRKSILRIDALYSAIKSPSFNLNDLEKSFQSFKYKTPAIDFNTFSFIFSNIDKMKSARSPIVKLPNARRGLWSTLADEVGKKAILKNMA